LKISFQNLLANIQMSSFISIQMLVAMSAKFTNSRDTAISVEKKKTHQATLS